MARPGITYEEVAAAADALVADGERPTINAVRDALGTGSPNTIHRHLQAWKATQAPARREAARLPDELAVALAEEIERQAARARADAEQAALEAQQTADDLAAVGEELESQVADLTELAELLSGERDQVTDAHDKLLEERDRIASELDRERVALEREREQHADARNRIITLTEQRDQLKTELIEAQASVKQAVQGQVQAERDAAVLVAKLDGEQAKSADLADRLTSEKAEARQAITERQAALDAVSGELMAALKRIAELEHEIADQRRQADAERVENQRLKEENRTLEAEAQRLGAEVLRLQQSDKEGE
jgi:chromosome segregation ATPase